MKGLDQRKGVLKVPVLLGEDSPSTGTAEDSCNTTPKNPITSPRVGDVLGIGEVCQGRTKDRRDISRMGLQARALQRFQAGLQLIGQLQGGWHN